MDDQSLTLQSRTDRKGWKLLTLEIDQIIILFIKEREKLLSDVQYNIGSKKWEFNDEMT